jgi:hypothetical protein
MISFKQFLLEDLDSDHELLSKHYNYNTYDVERHDAAKGRILSEEHKQKIREANLGKVLSEETKQKMSKPRSKGRI